MPAILFNSSMRKMAAWGRFGVCSSAVASVFLGQLALGREQRRKTQTLSTWSSSAAHIGSRQEEQFTWDANWDRRQPAPGSVEGSSRAQRHIILIRHGQYNLKGKGDAERYLSELGRQQADLTGQCLKELELGAGLKYTALHQSTMTRSMETAAIIKSHLPHVPLKTDPLLCEGAPIQPDPPSTLWKPEAKEFFRDGARIEAAFRKYFHRASPEQEEDTFEIIVGHANVIRYFVCRALQLPPEAWLRMSHGHCGYTHLTMRPNGRVVLKTFGDTGHLPPHMITYS